MSIDKLKRSLYLALAKVAQALASANRLQLLEYLAQGERSVEQLAAMAGLTVANTSRHLQGLRHAGLVVPRKQAQRVYYSIAGDEVVRLYDALRRAGEARAAEVEKLLRDYVGQRDALEPIRAAELLERARSGVVTVLDVRPPEEYAAGHLRGALNVPLERLESGLARLPKKREVVAYCRGPYCLMSFEAVAMLRKRGWRARRLEEGFPEWKAAGLPVERAAS
ncbi:MAG: metalloregulator ArsR/SmtB family transcription factor [Betaproteobacteria bacterium]|nr:metalloregulator ArsR/SmtB family transcription factor [Betaproteobacteria bacterium]